MEEGQNQFNQIQNTKYKINKQHNNTKAINQQLQCAHCKFKQCLCENIPDIDIQGEFCLLQHQDEQFRVTNTGILIEQTLKNKCDKFIWQRKLPNKTLLEKLNNTKYQPYLLYPGTEEFPSIKYPFEQQVQNYKLYSQKQQEINQEQPAQQNNQLQQDNTDNQIQQAKIPYFIIVDGIWKEASKIINYSEYLRNIPRLELNPENDSEFKLRRKQKKDGLCTCEVAIHIIKNCLKQDYQANQLQQYFQQFMQQFKKEQTKRVLTIENVVYDRFTRKKMLLTDYLKIQNQKTEQQITSSQNTSLKQD